MSASAGNERENELRIGSLKVQYYLKNFVLFILVAFDMYLNGTIDSLNGQNDNIPNIVIQIVVRTCTAFIMFLMMWNTFFFKYGLLGVIFKKFSPFFIVTPVAFFFTLSFRAVRLTKVIGGKGPVEIWEDDLYRVFYVLHSLCMICYYVACIHTSFALGTSCVHVCVCVHRALIYICTPPY
jgi:hypothetical protein